MQRGNNSPAKKWIARRNTMEQEIASLCAFAGRPADCEPFGPKGV
jgi:hypothetical protein